MILSNFVYLYNLYEIWLYNFQHKIAYLLCVHSNTSNPYTLLLLFFTGILTSVNPCFISFWPISISYINAREFSFFNKLVFFFGLLTSLLSVTLVINIFGVKYRHYIFQIPLASEFVLSIISLNLLQLVDLFPSFSMSRSNNNVISNFFSENYLVGFVIGISSLPCSTPVILIVNFWLFHSNDLNLYFLFIFIYTLGCITPFFFIINTVLNYIQISFVSYFWSLLIPVSGSLMLFISVLSFLEKFLS